MVSFHSWRRRSSRCSCLFVHSSVLVPAQNAIIFCFRLYPSPGSDHKPSLLCSMDDDLPLSPLYVYTFNSPLVILRLLFGMIWFKVNSPPPWSLHAPQWQRTCFSSGISTVQVTWPQWQCPLYSGILMSCCDMEVLICRWVLTLMLNCCGS